MPSRAGTGSLLSGRLIGYAHIAVWAATRNYFQMSAVSGAEIPSAVVATRTRTHQSAAAVRTSCSILALVHVA